MIALGIGFINNNYDNQFLDFKNGLTNKNNNASFAMSLNQLRENNICLSDLGKQDTIINFIIGLIILMLFIIKNYITLINAKW